MKSKPQLLATMKTFSLVFFTFSFPVNNLLSLLSEAVTTTGSEQVEDCSCFVKNHKNNSEEGMGQVLVFQSPLPRTEAPRLGQKPLFPTLPCGCAESWITFYPLATSSITANEHGQWTSLIMHKMTQFSGARRHKNVTLKSYNPKTGSWLGQAGCLIIYP